MTADAPPDLELFVVLSNDFGELFNAAYFARGLPRPATLLMPPRLFAANGRAVASHRAIEYRSVDDILRAVDSGRPGRVLLFSAYLYAINGLFDLAGLSRLLSSLRDRRIPCATSDPALGLLSAIGPGTFDPRHPAAPALRAHFGRLSAMLGQTLHLYLAPGPRQGAAPWASYFNPLLIEPAASPSPPRWLFILSAEDYAGQVARWGAGPFHDLLGSRLREGVEAGRDVTLIAPAPCLRRLGPAGAALVEALPLDEFMPALLGAECVFYWNLFSASILARVVNALPFESFDWGHLALAMPEVREAGPRHFYPGCRLDLLDFGSRLDPGPLGARWARHAAEVSRPCLANLERSPSPGEVLRRMKVEEPRT